MDLPDITGLQEMIAKAQEADNATAIASAQSETLQTQPIPATASSANTFPTALPNIVTHQNGASNWLDTFARDPAGNTLSVLVLIGMFASIVWAVTLFKKTDGIFLKENWAWIVPLLCAVGFGVAGYLTYVETTQVTAVCGPVGDCNTVQQSEYARLFGVLPIGVLGVLGYVAIFIAWLVTQFTRDRLAELAAISIFAMTAFGTLFSIYLTFLEPFVIGATCVWCLSSAILMTVLMLLSAGPAKIALSKKAHAGRSIL